MGIFRENTEGEYILGSQGIEVTPDLAIDFQSYYYQGSERVFGQLLNIEKMARRVTVVTKANVVKNY